MSSSAAASKWEKPQLLTYTAFLLQNYITSLKTETCNRQHEVEAGVGLQPAAGAFAVAGAAAAV